MFEDLLTFFPLFRISTKFILNRRLGFPIPRGKSRNLSSRKLERYDSRGVRYLSFVDGELKSLVKGFADLVRPMVETVDRHGLKSHFLRKHLVAVGRFYRRISGTAFQSESAIKFKERFEKNKDKLFTFLRYDGVPWNNNNAEHAIKAFAMLRHVIKGVTSEKGLRE